MLKSPFFINQWCLGFHCTMLSLNQWCLGFHCTMLSPFFMNQWCLGFHCTMLSLNQWCLGFHCTMLSPFFINQWCLGFHCTMLSPFFINQWCLGSILWLRWVTVLIEFQAAAFLEPASSNFKQPLNYTLPALAYGGQLDMEKPACLTMGHSYFHYYSLLTCPKILMNVTVSWSNNTI